MHKCESQFNHLKVSRWGAEQMAQVVNCLLDNHKDLGSIPSTYIKKPDRVMCTCKPSTGEQRQEPWDSLASQPSLTWGWLRKASAVNLWPPYNIFICTHRNTCRCIQDYLNIHLHMHKHTTHTHQISQLWWHHTHNLPAPAMDLRISDVCHHAQC